MCDQCCLGFIFVELESIDGLRLMESAASSHATRRGDHQSKSARKARLEESAGKVFTYGPRPMIACVANGQSIGCREVEV